MATLTNVIKKAEKASGQKIQIDKSGRHSVNYKGYNISFRANGRIEPDVEATNFYVLKLGDKDDSMTDYFAGTFVENITKAFRFVDAISKN